MLLWPNEEGTRQVKVESLLAQSKAAAAQTRLLFEDFPKNPNLILIRQPVLLANLDLAVNL